MLHQNINKDRIREIVKNTIATIPGKMTQEEICFVINEVMERIPTDRNDGFREKIVSVGKHFYHMGFLPGTAGNISVRLPDGSILITPSGISKEFLEPDEIVRVNQNGDMLENSPFRPSSETKMHLFSYFKRPDVNAIVHAHPPYSTGFAAAGIALDKPVLPEAILILGNVPLAKYGTPSTWEVPKTLEPYILDNNVFLLENHGAMTLGKDLKEAAHRMETLEFFAKVTFIARELGGEKILTAEQVSAIKFN